MNNSRFWSRLAIGSAFASSALAGCSADSTVIGTAPVVELGRSTGALADGCGNGVVEPELEEECDDGNTLDNDGCSSDCKMEGGWTCFGERPSICFRPDYGDAPSSYGVASHARRLETVSPFVGRDFWTTFSLNCDRYYASWQGLKVAGSPGTIGSVFDAGGVSIADFTIPIAGVVAVPMPMWNYEVHEIKTVVDKAFQVRADVPVRVVAVNEGLRSTDSWAVWSTEAIGTEYIVLDGTSAVPDPSLYGGRAYGWQLVVIGTQPSTTVEIKDASGALLESIDMDRGQVYRHPGLNPIVGWSVTSNNPIAVLAGVECTLDVGSGCDMTAEQLAPTSLWSREYVVAPGFENGCMTAKANHVVVASKDDTNVTVTDSNGNSQTRTLDARESWMFAIGDTTQRGFFVSADKPIGVVSNLGDPGHYWDPTLVTWPPVDGYVTEAKMPTPGPTTRFSDYLTIITRTTATDRIVVNDNAIPATNWKEIQTTGYSYARQWVPAGDNVVKGLDGVKFAAIAVGGADYVSYGYSSPYDIGLVGGDTTCYLGETPPDFEAPFTGSAECDQDDKNGIDDEDAIDGVLSVPHGALEYSLTVPCNDNFFGVQLNAKVNGFLDFSRDGTFGSGEHAQAPCLGATASSSGTATLTWQTPPWTDTGFSVLRLRICEGDDDCSSPSGMVPSGEVEDHKIHIGTCGDGYVDTWEVCDDGNLVDSDGCSSSCTVETGFQCEGELSECEITTVQPSPAQTTVRNSLHHGRRRFPASARRE